MAEKLGAILTPLAVDFVKEKIAKPLFNAAGRLVDKSIKALDDGIDHHPHDGAKTIYGIDLIMEELALDVIGHHLKLTILWSPDDKLNGKFFVNSGKHAKSARDKVIRCFEVLVKNTYKNMTGYTGPK